MRKGEGGSGALGNGAVVSVGAPTQSCLFGANNQIYFDASIPRRITQEDVANELGIGVTTVDRCLKGVGHPDTIESVKQAAERLGYKRVYKWASIKQEFIKGQNSKGRPVIDEQSVVILRKRGKSVRNISSMSGICIKRIKQILKINGESTENFQTIIGCDGLSKAQRHEIEMLKKEKGLSSENDQFKIKGSKTRILTALIVKEYKNGLGIEAVARKLAICKSFAHRCAGRTRAYVVYKKRRLFGRANLARYTSSFTYSRIYANEKSMLPDVEKKLIEKFSNGLIKKEAPVVSTFYGKKTKHLRADFVVEREKITPLAIEVKYSTDSASLKMLFGQIMVYRSCGFDVQCVFPSDVFLPQFAKNILIGNNVTYWTV